MLFHSVQVIPPCSMEIRTARNFLMLENLDYLPVYVYYVYYMSIYTYVRVTCMWIIYIYTVQYIYTICTWMDMYIVHVHTCLCIYLCMHVLLITINAFRIIRAVARSHPLSSTPSFCCRWRPRQGDQLIDSTNKNEGINPTLVRLVTTGSEIDAKFLLLLSVCCRFKKSIYGALGKLLLYFLTNHVFLGCYGFVLGLSILMVDYGDQQAWWYDRHPMMGRC